MPIKSLHQCTFLVVYLHGFELLHAELGPMCWAGLSFIPYRALRAMRTSLACCRMFGGSTAYGVRSSSHGGERKAPMMSVLAASVKASRRLWGVAPSVPF